MDADGLLVSLVGASSTHDHKNLRFFLTQNFYFYFLQIKDFSILFLPSFSTCASGRRLINAQPCSTRTSRRRLMNARPCFTFVFFLLHCMCWHFCNHLWPSRHALVHMFCSLRCIQPALFSSQKFFFWRLLVDAE